MAFGIKSDAVVIAIDDLSIVYSAYDMLLIAEGK